MSEDALQNLGARKTVKYLIRSERDLRFVVTNFSYRFCLEGWRTDMISPVCVSYLCFWKKMLRVLLLGWSWMMLNTRLISANLEMWKRCPQLTILPSCHFTFTRGSIKVKVTVYKKVVLTRQCGIRLVCSKDFPSRFRKFGKNFGPIFNHCDDPVLSCPTTASVTAWITWLSFLLYFRAKPLQSPARQIILILDHQQLTSQYRRVSFYQGFHSNFVPDFNTWILT